MKFKKVVLQNEPWPKQLELVLLFSKQKTAHESTGSAEREESTGFAISERVRFNSSESSIFGASSKAARVIY